MYFWLTEHPGWVGGSWKKTFIKRQRNIFFERSEGLDDGIPIGGGGVLVELLVGGSVGKKSVHLLKIDGFVQDDGCATFVCRKDADGVVPFKVLECLLFVAGNIWQWWFALGGKDASCHSP